MTQAMRLAKKKTVVAAAGLMMLCCVSLMVVMPALHRMQVPAVYLVVPMVLLEAFGLVVVVRSFVELRRVKRRENEG